MYKRQGVHRAAMHFADDDGESGAALHDGDVSDGVSGCGLCAGWRETASGGTGSHWGEDCGAGGVMGGVEADDGGG